MASIVQADGKWGDISWREHARADGARLAAFAVEEGDRARSLSLLIEREIIPRLVVAHASDRPAAIADARRTGIAAADVEALAALSLQSDADALLAQVEAIMVRDVTIDALLVDLIAPAARLLGQYWEDDRCDFLDVTMGLWRLQEAVHELAARVPPRCLPVVGGHRALFASMPGDQHSFGAVVIDELFRREGWATERITDAETADLVRRVAEDWFDLIGLTISCQCHIATLPSVIAALRNVSRNPRVCVMVGGWIFSAEPELATLVGADGTARDAKLALHVASNLVRGREREALVDR